ncbi:MAG TPA: molecular chaperone DjlA [Bacteroidales bacterium]|nr:MAG: molecular chaperone DjlA [Bacteroidetes bacterium GWF2_33_38]OFY73952.1 MAG: molecular chaperone DjlA [Bacteroidetes bacterium RIFOXYA12_FULL_33_9]OFY90890.1 MAG: molecular chaperone DjlA [Bacteroidetes bacterium RIFOXYA2_FULL_33_7]HBF88365.1 molecular chaperone DjlA [Bacteroidales bacterium]
MTKYGKWLAGGLGWAFFGPVGGLLGFALGSMIDSSVKVETLRSQQTGRGDFAAILVILVAAVMKADGKVLKAELDYVKRYFVKSFGEEAAKDVILLLREVLKKDIPLHEVNYQIRANLDYSSRLQLLHFLYGVASSDGHVHQTELDVIDQIAAGIGVLPKDAQSIKSMFVVEVDSAYKILEIEKSASNDEVKKAYRRMAVKYHPDKVSHLGDDMQKAANEKFQKVNEAYEKIKKERNFS